MTVHIHASWALAAVTWVSSCERFGDVAGDGVGKSLSSNKDKKTDIVIHGHSQLLPSLQNKQATVIVLR